MDAPDFLSRVIARHADLFRELREEMAWIGQDGHGTSPDDQAG
jgi:hypothetical protein